MPGVLKAKVDGTWVPIFGPGQGVPAGGVAGDVIVKNSANPFDAKWGTTIPKLKLTPGQTVGIDFNNPALQVGEETGQNLIAYWAGLMSRDNGAVSTLRLNYYGGQVIVGGGWNDPFTSILKIAESTHATSRRAGIWLGDNNQIGQDTAGNGTKDFYIFNNSSATFPLTISATGTVMNLGTSMANFKVQIGSGGTATLQIGDDAYFQDLNLTNGFVLRGMVNAGTGFLGFGGTGNKIGFTGTEFVMNGSGPVTMTGSRFNVLNAAGSAWLFNHDGTRLWSPHSIYSDSAVYASNWFRTYGQTGLYSESYAVGIYAIAAGWMSMYAGNLALADYRIHLRQYSDGNHVLMYYGGTPSGSGEANNGPLLQGYGSVWLNTVTGAQFFLSSGGNVFINAGKSYTVFSSREHKKNIVPLDPDESLEMVRRWQPVEFDLIADDTHAEGFISEEHVKVTPAMVNVCGPDSERPGWANAVDAGGGTVRLAGAVQALLARIEQLERKVA